MVEEDIAIRTNQSCTRATWLVSNGKMVVILRADEPLPELEHVAALRVVSPVVASTTVLVPSEDDTIVPHQELTDASRDLANHEVVVVTRTDEPVSEANIPAGLAMVPPTVRGSANAVTAPPTRVFSDQELRGVMVVMVNVVDVKMAATTIANIPVVELHSHILRIPACNGVAFPLDTESFAVLVASIRPAVATAVTHILEHPAMMNTTSVEIGTRHLVNRDTEMHVVVRMREVPALICPALATIVLVVGVVKDRNHVVPLARRVRIDTRGNTAERNPHESLATHPHGLPGTVRVLVFVVVVAPAMRSAGVIQRPAPV